MPIELNSCEILVPFELLQASKVPEDIELLMIITQLLINRMNKIDKNIDIINS